MFQPYYAWREFEISVAGVSVRWAGKPGLPSWDTLDPATRLLAEEMQVETGQRVLDLRCGAGICGALAARRGALVTLCDDNLVAVEAAQQTLALNDLSSQVMHGHAALEPRPGSEPGQDYEDASGSFDLVLLNAPRGREWVRHLLGLAARALRPGGKLLLAGPGRGGIKGFIQDAGEIVGPCAVTRIKASHRLAVAEKAGQLPADSGPPVRDSLQGTDSQVCSAQVGGRTLYFITRPGVFSRGVLDAGTRALIETMVIRPGELVLDLGCGCGVVGAAAAQTAGRVILVDCSAAALQSTRKTLEINGVSDRAQAIASDCASAVRDVCFDVVVTNPPFHQGLGVEFDVAQQFVRDAADVLAPGGRLFLVANRFIRYERITPLVSGGVMSGLFAQVKTAYQDRRFRVLEAVR